MKHKLIRALALLKESMHKEAIDSKETMSIREIHNFSVVYNTIPVKHQFHMRTIPIDTTKSSFIQIIPEGEMLTKLMYSKEGSEYYLTLIEKSILEFL